LHSELPINEGSGTEYFKGISLTGLEVGGIIRKPPHSPFFYDLLSNDLFSARSISKDSTFKFTKGLLTYEPGALVKQNLSTL
jgi:hypothetical protein